MGRMIEGRSGLIEMMVVVTAVKKAEILDLEEVELGLDIRFGGVGVEEKGVPDGVDGGRMLDFRGKTCVDENFCYHVKPGKDTLDRDRLFSAKGIRE